MTSDQNIIDCPKCKGTGIIGKYTKYVCETCGGKGKVCVDGENKPIEINNIVDPKIVKKTRGRPKKQSN